MNIREKRKEFTENHKKLAGVIAFLVFLIFMLLLAFIIGKPMLKFFSTPEHFRDWVENYGIFGEIAFVFMMAIQVIVALIPGEPLEMGAGYAFGFFKGTLLVVLGITLGSIVVFFLVKKWGVKFVEVFFSVEKINELKILKNKKQRNFLIFLVFFLPGTPKDLLTYFVGLTDIKTSHFILLASLSRLPSVITSTLSGDAFGIKEYKIAVIVIAITIILSIMGWLIYRFILKKDR